jgi:ribA/ribD-fused uncharacterized protein
MLTPDPQTQLALLCAAEAAGKGFKIMPFWGHKEFVPGCLSQWWHADFTADGVTYPTAEHYMMAGKARLFSDPQGLPSVLEAGSPGAAKAAGRKVRGFDETRWIAARYEIVVRGNLAKFGSHPDLKRFLLNTGDKVLVEASPFDRIWGIGIGPSHPDTQRPSAWRGQNLLGFALMEVRAQLRENP